VKHLRIFVAGMASASLLTLSLATAQPTEPANGTAAPAAPTTKVVPLNGDGGGAASGGGGVIYYNDGGDVAINTGRIPELHVVRQRDTLWDICWYYFNDPWQWPKVWSYNPQISNPHWIYPGDLVRLSPRGTVAATPASVVASKSDPVPEIRRSTPERSYSVELRQSAFVDQESIDTSIRIDGSVDEKELLAEGDGVFLTYDVRKPPKPGDRYSIYVPGEKVKSKGNTLGSYVRIVGTLEIVNVKKDKRARGVITETFEEVERGARVGELKRQLMTTPAIAPKVDAAGSIIARVTRFELVGQGEVVFLDLGAGSGIEVGNRMFVIRRGDALIPHMRPGEGVGQNDNRFPARAIGEVVIVDVGKKVSIGLVTLAVQELGVGDQVIMQAAAK
jgi:hypothetical protein